MKEETKKLTPKQEQLLIDRYNNMLELGGYESACLVFIYLQTLYAEKIDEGKPTLSESYAIGLVNLQNLIDIPFY